MTVIGEAWVKIRSQTAGFGKDVEQGIEGEMGRVAETAGSKHGGMFADSFGKGAKDGFSKLQLAGVIGATAGVAAVGVAGKLLYDLGSKFDEVSDKIRVKTGATGKALDALNDSFKNVAKQVPDTLEASGDVVASVAQKLALTGKPLEDLSVQFLNLAHITKGDVNAQMDSAIQLFRNFGISADQQGPALDKLFRASQASGVGFDQLSSAMAAAGPTLRQVGLDFDHSAAMVAALSKAGVDASQVMPGLAKAAATAAKEHKDASQVFQQTFDRIKNAKSDVDASSDALAVFGARAGPRMATLIREGKLSLDDMLKSIEGGKDTINKSTEDTEDFGEKWSKLKNQVFVGLAPLAAQVFDAMTQGITWITNNSGPAIDALGRIGESVKGMFDDVGGPLEAAKVAYGSFVDGITNGSGTADAEVGGLAKTFASIGTAVKGVVDFMKAAWHDHEADIKEILGQLRETFQSMFTAIGAIVEKITVVVTDIWDRFGNTLLGKARVAIDSIIEIFKGILETLKGIFDLITAVLTGKWGKAWDAILEILHGVWLTILGTIRYSIDLIAYAFEGAKALISAAWSAIWNSLATFFTTTVINPVKGGFDNLLDFVKGLPGRVADAAKGMWDGIAGEFKNMLNVVIRLWDSMHIPSFKIGGWSTPFGDLPSWNSPEVGFPHIPELRQMGGPVSAGSPYIVGEAGPELFVPGSSGSIMANSALNDLLASIPRGWTIADYVSNLVHATSISLQSASLLISDWVDRLGTTTAGALGSVSSTVASAFEEVAASFAPTGKAIDDLSKAIDGLGSAASQASSDIGSAVSSIVSAAQQASNSKPPTTSTSPTSPSTPTGDFHDFYVSQPEPVQAYLWSVGHPGGDPFPGYQLFDSGGWLMPGDTMARNLTGRPERILTADEFAGLSGGSSRPVSISQHNVFHGLDATQVAAALRDANSDLVDALTAELAAGFSPGSV